jgi:hypothetical protein
MIYLIGEGFAAASYAQSKYSWANQDPIHYLKGSIPHPANLNASAGYKLSSILHHPIQIIAHQNNSVDLVFREARRVADLIETKYIVLIFPTLFSGEILLDGQYIQFLFSQKELEIPDRIQKLILENIFNFNIETAQLNFKKQIQDLSAYLIDKGIQFCYMLAETTIDNISTDNWVIDPNYNSVRSWAENNGFLNEFGYLTPKGQTELTKLIIPYLTNQ